MIVVVNKRTHKSTPFDYYIGRGSSLGNIYTHKPLDKTLAQYQCDTREESIEKFKTYLNDKIRAKDSDICNALNDIYNMAKKGDVYLVCYCKDLSCHGDYIKEIIEEKLKK